MAEIHYRRWVYSQMIEMYKEPYKLWPKRMKALKQDIDKLGLEQKLSPSTCVELKKMLSDMRSEGVR